jgi:hypothetical protein
VEERDCDFCGRGTLEGDTPFAISVENLLDQVIEAIRYFYTDALGELPWDNEEGSYVGPVYRAQDVVGDICDATFADSVADEVMTHLSETIGHSVEWTDWGASGDSDNLEYAWNDYVKAVQEQSRFIAIESREAPLGFDPRPPYQLGAFLRGLLTYIDGPLGLVTTMPAGTPLFRGRLVEGPGEVELNAGSLGPAPSRKTTANRMSPAGVSFFYGSETAQTAIAEIAGHGVKPLAVIGEFRTARTLTILDFTRRASVTSIFTENGRHEATLRGFLRTFIEAITRPIIPDGRQHIEYVPTQVLTEYFRWVPDTHIDGVALPSSQTGDKTYVLFFGPDVVADADEQSESGEAAGLVFGELESPALTLKQDDIRIYKIERRYEGVLQDDRYHLWRRAKGS